MAQYLAQHSKGSKTQFRKKLLLSFAIFWRFGKRKKKSSTDNWRELVCINLTCHSNLSMIRMMSGKMASSLEQTKNISWWGQYCCIKHKIRMKNEASTIVCLLPGRISAQSLISYLLVAGVPGIVFSLYFSNASLAWTHLTDSFAHCKQTQNSFAHWILSLLNIVALTFQVNMHSSGRSGCILMIIKEHVPSNSMGLTPKASH